MDIKSLRDREFNKRVRDVVSRDQNRLRETFSKYDKECAERMAEIHHMQEKVRFSMRSLAMDKIHMKQASSAVTRHHRRSSESRVKSEGNDSTRDHDGQHGKQTKRDANEFSKRHRSSVTSGYSSKPRTLDIPGAITRRLSSSFTSQTSGNVYFTGNKPAMSSSCPDNSGYLTLGKTRLADNTLSVNDVRISTKSPVINLRRKSADEVRGNRQVSERKDRSPNRLRTEPCSIRQRSTSISHLPSPEVNSPVNQRKLSASGRKGGRDRSPNRLEPCSIRQRSTSISHLPSPDVNSPRNQRKLSASGHKVELVRTRSNSLPESLSPSSTLTASSEDMTGTHDLSKPVQISSSEVGGSPLARSFEEMKHCRYLRCSDT